MKNLSILLQEKLKINSKSKVNNKDDIYFSKEECIVVPFSKIYDEFSREFPECEITSKFGPDIFVIHINYLDEYKNLKTSGMNQEIDFIKIPDEYSSFEEIKDDYENGKLDLDELEKLKF